MASTTWSFRPRRTSGNLPLARSILLVLQPFITKSLPFSPHHCECKHNKRVFWKGRTAEERLKKDKNGVHLTPKHGNDNIKQGLDVCIDTIMTSQFMLMLSNH